MAPRDEPWTTRRVIAWSTQDFQKRGLDSPRLDAELLVAHALGLTRVQLYLDLDRPLSADELARARELIARRRRHEPVAYILGRREFYGRSFEVSPAVLVPRPDTETLVERALALVVDGAPVLELCTGSGCIAITIAAERPGVTIDASDLSPDALAVARRNAESLAVADRVRFFEGDLFAALPERTVSYAIILANPPYLAEREVAELAPDVAEHEPRMALVAGPDGLEVIRRIVAGLEAALAPGGTLLLEVGATQAASVAELLGSLSFIEHTARHRDLGGIERVVEARRRS